MSKARKMIIIRDVIGSHNADSIEKGNLIVDAISEASKQYSIIGLNFSGLNFVTVKFLNPIVKKKMETDDCEIYMCNLNCYAQELLLESIRVVTSDATCFRR